jgi:hypothetical protein
MIDPNGETAKKMTDKAVASPKVVERPAGPPAPIKK